MFECKIKTYDGKVIFNPNLIYNTYIEAQSNGLDYLYSWEEINNCYGTLYIEEVKEKDDKFSK